MLRLSSLTCIGLSSRIELNWRGEVFRVVLEHFVDADRGTGPISLAAITRSDADLGPTYNVENARGFGGHGLKFGQFAVAYNGVPDTLFVTVVAPFWLPAACLAAAGVPTWGQLRRDWAAWRAATVGRCAGCGHDLRGNASGVCPECGRKIVTSGAANPAADFVRRRWR